MAEEEVDKSISRKLIVTLTVFFTSALLLVVGKIAGSEFVTVASVTISAYMAGNVGEHYTDSKG